MTNTLKLALAFRARRKADDERAFARLAAAEQREAAEQCQIVDAAEHRMERVRQQDRHPITLGTSLSSRGTSFPVLLTSEEVWGGHWSITGATGAGKTFLAISLLLQRFRHNFGRVVVIDMKGELAGLLRNVVIPSFIGTVGERHPEDALRLVSKVAVLAPFDNSAIPPFQVLARDPALSIQEQAHEVASSFGRTIGRDLGVIQETVLRYAFQLAIDTQHNLLDVARLLVDDDLRRAALERTRLEDVKHYFATRFPRERASSVGALLSRLDSLTMYPSLRRMLSAPGMVRLPALLESAVTIIDLGGSPGGMRDVSQFLGQLFFQKLVRAIFARRVRLDGQTPPVTIVADEFQELLTPDITRDFERFLTLARSQRCFLWLLYQQAAQLEAKSPSLLRIVRTNVRHHALFNSALEDARPFAHFLPVTGRRQQEQRGFPDPRQPERFLTHDDERRELVELVPRMPDRVYWFCHPRADEAYPTVLVRSPHVDMPSMQAQASSLSPDLLSVITRGVVALQDQDQDGSEPEPGRGQERNELTPAPERITPPPDAAAPAAEADVDGDADIDRAPAKPKPSGKRRPSLG